MSVLDILLGKPLATSDERAEQIGTSSGIPIFGLDALSSAAYGPEAALTLLIPLGAAGVAYIVPVSLSIIVLLTIVYFSYRQTKAALIRLQREQALAAARLGGIGYHPSLLPRHRGIAAVEWTIREGDPIAGGTVYHLAERMDAGAPSWWETTPPRPNWSWMRAMYRSSRAIVCLRPAMAGSCRRICRSAS